MTDKTRKTVVFIVGSYYSGSTVLGSILGTLPGVALLGEVDRFRPFGRFPKSEEHYLDKCSICSTHAVYDCPVWPVSFNESVSCGSNQEIIDFYCSIVERSAGNIVIDSSKNIDWLRLLSEFNLPFRFCVITMIRSPFGFVSSCKERIPDESVITHAEGWRNVYHHVIRTLNGFGIASLVVRFEDLLGDIDRVSDRISSFLGIDGMPINLDGGREGDQHPMGGNLRELCRYKGFDLERFLTSGQMEARALARDLEEYPEYKSNRMLLVERKNGWKKLSDDQIRDIIQLPGLVDVFSYFGYDLLEYIVPRR